MVALGVLLPFLVQCVPPWHAPCNLPGAFQFADWTSAAVAELVADGAISPCSFVPWITAALGVVPKSTPGRYRLIIDLRYVNFFLRYIPFRMETLPRCRSIFRRGDFLFSIDLRNAYHTVEIAPEHRKFLGFCWAGQYYVYNCLPFGLSCSPVFFSELVHVLVKRWRRRGVRCIAYLDDLVFAASSLSEARRVRDLVLRDIDASGFVVNFDKSVLEPCTSLKVLGFQVDTVSMTFSIPAPRLSKMRRVLQELLSAIRSGSRVPSVLLSRVLGHIVSASLVLGPPSRFATRFCYRDLSSIPSSFISSDCWVSLSPEGLDELLCWERFLASDLIVADIHPCRPRFDVMVFTDASATGWSGVPLFSSPGPALGVFSPEDCLRSSSFRELLAILFTVQSFAPVVPSFSNFVVYSDSFVAARVVENHGSQARDPSGDLHLHRLFLAILDVCYRFGLFIHVFHVPRSLNCVADFYSRFVDHADYGLSDAFFGLVASRWGPFAVDRFASSSNTRCARFMSRFFCPGCEAVDALLSDWSPDPSGLVDYIHPPFALVPPAINKLIASRAMAVLVVPQWFSAPWWPVLFPFDANSSPVLGAVSFAPFSRVFSVAHPATEVFSGSLNFSVLALLVDFRNF